MKATLLLALLFLFLIENGNAQAPSWQWVTSPSGIGYIQTHSVAVDDSGNVYSAGYYYNTSATFGSFTLNNSGNDDIYVVKYDSSGNVIWAKGLGGADYDEARGIALDHDGNIYVTGIFDSPSLTFGSSTIMNAGSGDIFLLKYDNAGNELWATSAGGTGPEFGEAVAVDYAGNIFVAGSFSSPTIDFGSFTLTNAGDEDVCIVKYDPAGNVLWAKSGSGTGLEWAICLSTDPYGNVIMGGPFYSNTIDFSGSLIVNTLATESIFIVKYDSTGNVMWTKQAASNGFFNEVYSIATDALGDIFVLATVNGDTAYFDSLALFAPLAGYWDMVLAKYNSAGTILWAKKCGGWGSEYGNAVATDASGNAYVIGHFDSDTLFFDSTHFVVIDPAFYSDIFTVKYDPDGNVVWSKSNSGIDQQVSFGRASQAIAVDKHANVFIAGSAFHDSVAFDSATFLLNGNFESAFVAKLNDAGACSAAFGLFPDSTTQHLYWALNQASGTGTLSYLWEWGDGSTDTTAYPSHTYATGGFYPICCTITDSTGCTNTVCHTMQLLRMGNSDQLNSIVYVNVVASIPVSIEQKTSDHEILIYPNPTNGKFDISFPEYDHVEIEVVNALGKKVYSQKMSRNQNFETSIDFSNQPPGIYFVLIHHVSGIAVLKLIVN